MFAPSLPTDRIDRARARTIALLALVACGDQPGARTSGDSSPTLGVPGDTGAASSEAGGVTSMTTDANDGGSSAGDADDALKFDLGDGAFCESKAAGLFCDGNTAVQ
ncbi:MAG TPA: hypothetical protein VFG69_00305, partial [Nannocystaceae bacterium]|nr:hypothetical protein [Nannocystaceae bacterium]